MQIFCIKLKKMGTALTRKPLPGELGERILNNVSDEAWQLWLSRQTMLINEYRLISSDPQAQQFLREQLENFLFCDNEVAPQQFNPE